MSEFEAWSAGVSVPVLDDAISRDWLSTVHAALRAATPRGRVVSRVRAPGAGWNYYSVLIQTGDDQPRRLLLNAAARLVACAYDEGSPALGPLRFCEVPSPELYAADGFRVVSVAELEAPLRPERVAALSPDERADIAYHQPDTVGDVLFNWFD